MGSLFGALVVAMGAYGAHAGTQYLSSEAMVTFNKAVRYNMFHAFALLITSLAIYQWPKQEKLLTISGWFFTTGLLTFSGGLYLLALTKINLGYIIPLGGVCFICGWLLLAAGAWFVEE